MDEPFRLYREKVHVKNEELMACPFAAEQRVMEMLFNDAILYAQRDGGKIVKIEIGHRPLEGTSIQIYTVQVTMGNYAKGEIDKEDQDADT